MTAEISPGAEGALSRQTENKVFYPALDGLRGMAFLMVFAQHYRRVPWMWSGVDVFFVLSGFLITGILFDCRDLPHRVRTFYVRRTLRIFPLYYGLFFIFLVLTPLLRLQWHYAWLAWPLYVGNYLRFWRPYVPDTVWQSIADAQIHNSTQVFYLGHLWSLCVEEQFYLFWPWIVFFVRSRRALLWICGLSVVLMPLLRVFVQHHASQNMLEAELLYRATPFRIDALLLGGLAALWLRGTQREAMLRAARWLFWILTAVVVGYTGFSIHASGDYVYPTWRLTWGLVFVDFYAVSILLLALQPGSMVSRLFGLKQLRWLGRISYGAYVFHDIYHHVIADRVFAYIGPNHEALNDALTAVSAFVITLVVAALSFRFFETPFLRLKERWAPS